MPGSGPSATASGAGKRPAVAELRHQLLRGPPGAGDADLLAEHRAHRELPAAPGARHADPGARARTAASPRERGGIVAGVEHARDDRRVGIARDARSRPRRALTSASPVAPVDAVRDLLEPRDRPRAEPVEQQLPVVRLADGEDQAGVATSSPG